MAQDRGRSDTELVLAARADDRQAFGELFDRWFNSSWNVARNVLRNDEQAADIAQDAMLAAWQGLDKLDDPDAFGGWLLRITRNRALTRLERENRSRATGDDVVSGLRDSGLPDPTGAASLPEPDVVNEVRDRQELVWAAAAALGERDASLLDLHLRHGLTPAELATEMGVEANNAHQQLYRMRNKLGDAIGSYLLWRNGRPLCEGLAAAVSGEVAFDRSVARAVSRHQASCDDCSERRSALVDPGKMFAAVPMVLVPTQLKLNAAAALQSAGVPIDGGQGPDSNQADGDSTDSTQPDSTQADPAQSDSTQPDSTRADPAQSDSTQSDSGQSDSGSDWGQGDLGGQSAGVGGDGGGSTGFGQAVPTGASGQTNILASSGASAGGAGAGGTGSAGGIGSGAGIGLFKMLAVAVGAALLAGLAMWTILLLGSDDGDGVAAGLQEEVSGPGLEPLVGSPAELGQPDAEEAGVQATLGLSAPEDSAAAESTTTGETATGQTDTTQSTETTQSSSTETSTSQSTSTPTSTATSTSTPTSTTVATTTTSTTTTTVSTTARPTTTVSISTASVTRPTTASTPTTGSTTSTSTSSSSSSSSSSTTEPPEAPKILRFTTGRPTTDRRCADPNASPFRVLWATEHTDSVTLTLPSGSVNGKPNGSHEFCATSGQRVSLLAVGPGGEDKASITL